MKAYLVRCKAINSSGGVYAAESAGKAKYQSYLSARDVGWRVEFKDFQVRRAPEFDPIIPDLIKRRGSGLAEEFARVALEQLQPKRKETHESSTS